MFIALALAVVSTFLVWENGQAHYTGPLDLHVSLTVQDSLVDAVSYPNTPSNTPSLLQPTMVADNTLQTQDSNASDATPTLETITERLETASQSVAQYVSTSYRIALDRAKQLTNMAIEIGEAKNVDPLLIMAVVAIESSYNAKARSPAGAEGLMQVMTSVHRRKYSTFGGEAKAFDPYANMSVGTDILNELIQRTGSVRKALKWYSGAANLASDRGYSARVLAERYRLAIAASGNAQDAILLSQSGSVPPDSNHLSHTTLAFEDWVNIATQDG